MATEQSGSGKVHGRQHGVVVDITTDSITDAYVRPTIFSVAQRLANIGIEMHSNKNSRNQSINGIKRHSGHSIDNLQRVSIKSKNSLTSLLYVVR